MHAAVMQDKWARGPINQSVLNPMGKYLPKLLKLGKIWEDITRAEIMYGNVVSNINETHPGKRQIVVQINEMLIEV